jgi:hypothetical protein
MIRHRNANACALECRRAQLSSWRRSAALRMISTVGRPRFDLAMASPFDAGSVTSTNAPRTRKFPNSTISRRNSLT